MALSREGSLDETFDFNDMSQETSANNRSAEDGEQRRESQDDGSNEVPKPKRIACVLCRKRKLRCDSNRPSCSTCIRLQHECSYDEVRKKSGPKRGYVKALEARLAQVETLLKTQDDPPSDRPASHGNGKQSQGRNAHGISPAQLQDTAMIPEAVNISLGPNTTVPSHYIPERSASQQNDGSTQAGFSIDTGGSGSGNFSTEDSFPWEMIGLGLDEPLPTQDVIDELNQLYFDKIHPSMPMIHRPRYYAAMNLAPHMRPPVCLRYAMWAMAAAATDKYDALQDHFYQRARKYIHQDEMRGHGENIVTVGHAQTWILLGTFEFKNMSFPRAWMSSGRACRLTQMMGMHRLDGQAMDVKQCLPPPKDWTDREERRRTFWMSFCVDRYASIGTGWPMTIEEADIKSNIPADEEAYELSRQQQTGTLEDMLVPGNGTNLSGFSGVVLMACLFGRNLTHLHRPGPEDRDHDLNGDFWKRHRSMDNILLGTALALPDHLRIPAGVKNPNIVFLNMSIHTSTICLHQAAIFKADRNRMASRVSAESKVRCITAAAEIATIMRTICHLDLSTMNPFISFCLYVAARVFVQYLKSRPKDTQVRASLQFLLSAMHAIKRKNPLTESFLVQLDIDLEGAGLETARSIRAEMPMKPTHNSGRASGCPDSFGMKNPPAYGDAGLAVYNDPDPSKIPILPSQWKEPESFNYNNLDMTDSSQYLPNSIGSRFELPSRQRSPGSSGAIHPEMDTSPDGSGDHHTPNSSSQHNLSSHTSNTSHTGHSPQNIDQTANYQQTPTTTMPVPNLFDTSDQTFDSTFDMNSFSSTNVGRSPSRFDIYQNLPSQVGQGGSSTGLTPSASTGLTPGPEMMGMTDAEWSQMLDNFGSWDTAAGIDHGGLLSSRR